MHTNLIWTKAYFVRLVFNAHEHKRRKDFDPVAVQEKKGAREQKHGRFQGVADTKDSSLNKGRRMFRFKTQGGV